MDGDGRRENLATEDRKPEQRRGGGERGNRRKLWWNRRKMGRVEGGYREGDIQDRKGERNRRRRRRKEERNGEGTKWTEKEDKAGKKVDSINAKRHEHSRNNKSDN